MNKVSQTIPYQIDTGFSPFKASEFDLALDFLEERGFTGAELAIAYPAQVDAKALLKQLESHHLTATTISTGQIYGLEGLYLSSFDESVRNRAVKVIKEHVDLSVNIGLPPVTIGLVRGKLEKGDKKSLIDNLRFSVMNCVEYSQKRGVSLQIEPINKSETNILNNVYETLEFIDGLGNPENLGLLYDTYHSNIEDGGMTEAIKAAAGRIKNVHFADSDRGLPGYGTLDFPEIFKAVIDTGYQGAFALETLSKPSVEFVRENCASSILQIVRP